ncbi:hypothetical protein [Altererythrobacter sp. GH1-8]|uniref:hypothetical protein n=1 Tax=Altererythrobacter sp. GH1-8 TaxID=3349333 RepID=UPI00374DCDBC
MEQRSGQRRDGATTHALVISFALPGIVRLWRVAAFAAGHGSKAGLENMIKTASFLREERVQGLQAGPAIAWARRFEIVRGIAEIKRHGSGFVAGPV